MKSGGEADGKEKNCEKPHHLTEPLMHLCALFLSVRKKTQTKFFFSSAHEPLGGHNINVNQDSAGRKMTF